jgi:glycine cleavage system H lipoate-binding protein
MSLKQTFNKVGMSLKKHSPAIFTGVGVVGLGVTAYLAYKSRDKVEKVVSEIERKREVGEEINKIEVAKGLAEAIYLPVAVGTLSVTSMLMAHKIQRDRIISLMGISSDSD